MVGPKRAKIRSAADRSCADALRRLCRLDVAGTLRDTLELLVAAQAPAIRAAIASSCALLVDRAHGAPPVGYR